jgi:hypothetical protein
MKKDEILATFDLTRPSEHATHTDGDRTSHIQGPGEADDLEWLQGWCTVLREA